MEPNVNDELIADIMGRQLKRIALTGPPRSGKTTLSKQLERHGFERVMHTDDLAELDWHDASDGASLWFNLGGSLVVEGTATVRALRKWMDDNPAGGKPVDAVIHLAQNKVPLTKQGQRSMAKGIVTMLNGIIPELSKRGVSVLVA